MPTWIMPAHAASYKLKTLNIKSRDCAPMSAKCRNLDVDSIRAPRNPRHEPEPLIADNLIAASGSTRALPFFLAGTGAGATPGAGTGVSTGPCVGHIPKN